MAEQRSAAGRIAAKRPNQKSDKVKAYQDKASQNKTPATAKGKSADAPKFARIKPEQRRTKQKSFRRRPKSDGIVIETPKPADGKVRLNKYLADSGVTSRRKADELIGAGEVTINGRKVFELGIRVDPKHDKILFRGKPLREQKKFVYFVFNKPRSVVTSTVDPQGRPTVIDYFGKIDLRIFPVGRLDWDSEGLLLITNDGEFAQKVIHPEADVPKTYHVKLNAVPTDVQLEKLRKGVSIIGGKVAALHVKRLAKSTDKKSWIEITIAEGKNHQIKHMFAKIGHDVIKLRRVAIGELWMNASLKPGDFRELTYADLKRIFKQRPKKDKGTKEVHDDNALIGED